MENITANQGLLKDINRKKILSVIRNAGQISRIEVTKIIKQDSKTVTNIVNSLISDGLIKSSGYSEYTGGRRRELLSLNEHFGYTIGLDLDVDSLRGILTDFKSNILIREKLPSSPSESKSIIVAKIKKTIDFLIKKSNVSKEQLIGIGFVAPGLYDRSTGVWIRAVNIPNLPGLPIGKVISDQCNCAVYLEDSSRAKALGEKWFGIAKGKKNYIFLDIGVGIGCGIVQNNRLYRGSSNLAGEIGHTNVVPDGRLCSCGKHGCLEAEASGYALENQVKEYLQKGNTSRILNLSSGDIDKVTIDTIFKAAHDGDDFAVNLLNNAGKYLGIAIANLINLLNPELIIIGGHFSAIEDFNLLSLEENIKIHALSVIFEKVTVKTSLLGDDASLLGATTLVLDKIFNLKLMEM